MVLPFEEIDAYIAEERTSPERWEWHQQFYDLMTKDSHVRSIGEILRRSPHQIASYNDRTNALRGRPGTDGVGIDNALEGLTQHGGVRRLNGAPSVAYRLVREFAGP